MVSDSDEEIKTKKKESKPKTPRTKKTVISEDVESKDDQVFKDVSSINPVSDDEFKLNQKGFFFFKKKFF